MMNNFIGLDTRNRRSLLNKSSFPPVHFPVADYSTKVQTKEDMKHTYDGLFINNLHLIPDPLKKNLADSVVSGQEANMVKTKDLFIKEAKEPPNNRGMECNSKLSGLINIFSSVMSVMGAMFQKRNAAPSPPYYDCFESEFKDNSNDQMADSAPWQPANFEIQNKSVGAQTINDENNHYNWKTEMISDYQSPLTHNQINEVCLLFGGKSKHVQIPNSQSKSFEPGSAEVFEDAFSPEDFASLPNDSYLEYCSPFCYQEEELCEVQASQLKTEITQSTPPQIDVQSHSSEDHNVVTSCEDKLNKIKALLQSKCTTKSKKINEDDKTEICENIVKDAHFGNEINIENINKKCLDHFDEIKGKFYSSSVESDDSFQIVFSDDHKTSRERLSSECESEDSFIVFEDSPDSCYISDDVFGDVCTNDCSDSETEGEDDSGCGSTKLLPKLSRTVEDLTIDKLYEEDVVDCAPRKQADNLVNGVSQNQEKLKKSRKKVHFSPLPPKVHVMRVWAFAARQARIGQWEQDARDRDRFKSRIADVEMAISWVLKPKHRSMVMFQRFMPWWNAQKRKELKEKAREQEKAGEQPKDTTVDR